MLDEAGWVVGADGIREKDGEKFSFTMMNRAGRQDRIAVAQVIQAQLKEIGIDVQFETLEAPPGRTNGAPANGMPSSAAGSCPPIPA